MPIRKHGFGHHWDFAKAEFTEGVAQFYSYQQGQDFRTTYHLQGYVLGNPKNGLTRENKQVIIAHSSLMMILVPFRRLPLPGVFSAWNKIP